MSLIYTYDDYRFFNDKLSEWYTSLLMAMSVIASYVICMRASSVWDKVRRTENFRLGVHVRQKRTEKQIIKFTFRIREHVRGAKICERRETLFRPFSILVKFDMILLRQNLPWFNIATKNMSTRETKREI